MDQLSSQARSRRSPLAFWVPVWGVAAIALTALIGWGFGVPKLASWATGLPGMKPVTAASFLFLVAALLAVWNNRPTLANWLGWAVVAIGGVSLVQHLAGVADTEILPSTVGAAMFLGLGAAVARQARPDGWAASLLAALVGVVAFSELIQIGLDSVDVHRMDVVTAVSMPTAMAFLLLSGALLTRRPLNIDAIAADLRIKPSIRLWLLTLAVAAALPLFGFGFYAANRLATAERTNILTQLERRAEAAGFAIDEYLAAAVNLATLLAGAPDALLNDLPTFHAFATHGAERTRHNVLLVAPDGRILATTSRPLGAPLPNYANPQALAETRARRTSTISDLFTENLSGTATFSALAPVIRDGLVTALVVVNIAPGDILSLIHGERLPDSWIGLVIDRAGTVVSRSLSSDSALANIAAPELIAARAAQQRGRTSFTHRDGIPVAAYHITLASGWTVALQVSLSQLEATIARSLVFVMTLGVITLLVAGGFALLVGRHLSRQVTRVAEAAASGGMAAPWHSTVQEIDQVAETLAETQRIIRLREHALRDSAAFGQSLFEANPDCVKILDQQGRIEQINANGLSAMEIDDFDSVRGKYWPDLWPKEAHGDLEAAMVDARSGRTGRLVAFCPTTKGTPKWWDVVVTAVPVGDGQPARLITSSRDITERRAAEDQLRHNSAILELAEQSAGIGVWTFDFTTRMTTGTAQFFRLQGLDPDTESVPIETLRALRHPEDRERMIADFDNRLAHGDDLHESEYRIMLPAAGEGSDANGARIRWIFGRGQIIRSADGKPLHFSGVDIDVTARKQHEQQIELLVREVNHRSKNMLGVVLAIARHTAARGDPQTFIQRFDERIQALSASQDLLISNDWQGADMAGLVRAQLAHFKDLVDSRIKINGPAIRLVPAAAQAIGMALHELATNAGKYGALSTETGQVAISWEIKAGQFIIDWVESGGPPVTPPERTGFGTTVVGAMARMSLQAEVQLDYATTGVTWHLECPTSRALDFMGPVFR